VKKMMDLGVRSFDDLFNIGRYKWDINCFYFESDPIYDIDYESEVNIVDVKPNLEDCVE